MLPELSNNSKDIKQLYINGHFCYVYKFGLITNGLGIVRDISFYNNDFLDAHPEIVIDLIKPIFHLTVVLSLLITSAPLIKMGFLVALKISLV